MSRLHVLRAVLIALALAGCGQSKTNTPPPGAGGGGASPAGGSGGTPSGGSGGPMGGAGGSAMGGAGGGAVGGTSGSGGSAVGGTGGTSSDAASDRGGSADAGPAKVVLVASGLSTPFGVAVDPMTGDLYSAEYGDNRVRRIDRNGMATVVVGPGAAGAGGQMTLDQPHDVLFQPGTRTLFIADTFGSRVLRLDVATGAINVLAGAGAKIPTGGRTYALAFDPTGATLYFTGGGGIRVVDLKTETLKTTLAYDPRVIAVDSKGTLYAVKNGGTALETVDATGRATAVPGGSPVAAPKHITTDRDDNVIIVDTETHSIREYVLATKSIVRLAGNGTAGTGRLDGPPEMAQTDRPHGAIVDAAGRILIADSFNNRIIAIVH